MEKESIVFKSKEPYKGYTVTAWYLKKPNDGDAVFEIYKDGQLLRQCKFPAYKIWNIAAHFNDIVDGEIEESTKGYQMAAWDGISGAIFINPEETNV